MSRFERNGKHFELNVETDEDNRDVVVLYVDEKKVDEEYVTLRSATHDMENISEVETSLLVRNGYEEEVDADGDEEDNDEWEPTEEEKRKVLKELVNEHEIMMCFDGTHFRPLWKNEYDVNTEAMDEKQLKAYIEKYQPYEATEEDINRILEYGSLEWESWNESVYVKIWW